MIWFILLKDVAFCSIQCGVHIGFLFGDKHRYEDCCPMKHGCLWHIFCGCGTSHQSLMKWITSTRVRVGCEGFYRPCCIIASVSTYCISVGVSFYVHQVWQIVSSDILSIFSNQVHGTWLRKEEKKEVKEKQEKPVQVDPRCVNLSSR